MQTESKDGIICDLCGGEFHYKFIYISTDIFINGNLDDSLDLCQECFNNIYSNIKTNQGKCELCGENIIDHSIKINFDEVEVDLQKYQENGTNVHKSILTLDICLSCKNKFFKRNKYQ